MTSFFRPFLAIYARRRILSTGFTNFRLSRMSTFRVVDIRSDTVTKPTSAMRQAMAQAEVGDDVYKEDPTVNELEKQAASLMGKEAGLFVPSGTMGNLIAVLVHCETRGMEFLVGDESHIILHEAGGAAHLGGVQPRTLATKSDATFDVGEIKSKIRRRSLHGPETGLICVENTHNKRGGQALPLNFLEELNSIKTEHQVKLHMDGARIMNASVYCKVPPAELCRHFDSVCFCLSKGLSAPVGSVLVGSKDFIYKATLMRKMLGGGMRQAGILAAAGLVSLSMMINRLEEDHKLAKHLAEAINSFKPDIASVDINCVHTNIILIQVNPKYITCEQFCERLKEVTSDEARDIAKPTVVKLYPFGGISARAVIHSDISSEDIEAAIIKIKYVIDEIEKQANNL